MNLDESLAFQTMRRNIFHFPWKSFGKPSQMKKEKKKDLKHRIRFVDSLKFMNSSLANLVKNLGKDDLHFLKRFFPNDVDLLSRKGVFPYEWVDSFEKFDFPSLPEKDAFFSQLNGEGISDEDFQHAQNVWQKFNMKNMGDYHDLYLQTDVFLLADVIENFRKVLLENYHLDPAWFLTSPSFVWDAMLKMTKIELELLTEGNMEMFRFFERQIEEEFLRLFTDFPKQTTNSCQITIHLFPQNSLSISMQIPFIQQQ